MIPGMRVNKKKGFGIIGKSLFGNKRIAQLDRRVRVAVRQTPPSREISIRCLRRFIRFAFDGKLLVAPLNSDSRERRGKLLDNAEIVHLGTRSHLTGFPTNQELDPQALMETDFFRYDSVVMSTSARRTLLVLAIVGVGLLALYQPWAKFLYHGDGRFSDLTVLHRPRCLVRFNEIPISQTGNYQYHFRGLPHEELTLTLHVKGRKAVTDEELKSLQAAIETVLRDSRGIDVCKSSRLLSRMSPELNSQDSVWVLSGTSQDRLFWHWQCHNFQAYSRESYELTIRVTKADHHGEKIFFTPTLEGGGIEFP